MLSDHNFVHIKLEVFQKRNKLATNISYRKMKNIDRFSFRKSLESLFSGTVSHPLDTLEQSIILRKQREVLDEHAPKILIGLTYHIKVILYWYSQPMYET